ncbi:MAG: PQQ-like beta-propeller repeat protein [Bacteroidales bacterium]|nr:PQQ-like beta-propeller repeat protein [Bacteroidales bacterium]
MKQKVWLLSCILVVLCSCCKSQHEQGSLRPEWSAQIPTFESPYIFYSGILNLPKSGDIIVLPTTIHDGGFMWEDNRLCGMDLKTGEVKWYFPSNLDKRQYCYFNSKGYEYHGKLVFQYETNRNEDTSLHSTACLEVSTGSVLWKKDYKISRSIRPVIGSEKDCYFVQDSCRICRVDMNNDQISEFYYTGDDGLQINDLQLCNDLMVISCFSESEVEEFQDETYVIIVDVETGTEIFRKYLGRYPVPAHSFLEGNIIYSNLERKIMAIDMKTGDIIWEHYELCMYGFQDLCISNDVLMSCCINATAGYNKKTGEMLYLFDNYGSYHVTQAGKYAYFINRKNKLDILDIETGERLDYVECPENGPANFWLTYPTIYDDKLYIIGNNTLYRYPTYPW